MVYTYYTLSYFIHNQSLTQYTVSTHTHTLLLSHTNTIEYTYTNTTAVTLVYSSTGWRGVESSGPLPMMLETSA